MRHITTLLLLGSVLFSCVGESPRTFITNAGHLASLAGLQNISEDEKLLLLIDQPGHESMPEAVATVFQFIELHRLYSTLIVISTSDKSFHNCDYIISDASIYSEIVERYPGAFFITLRDNKIDRAYAFPNDEFEFSSDSLWLGLNYEFFNVKNYDDMFYALQDEILAASSKHLDQINENLLLINNPAARCGEESVIHRVKSFNLDLKIYFNPSYGELTTKFVDEYNLSQNPIPANHHLSAISSTVAKFLHTDNFALLITKPDGSGLDVDIMAGSCDHVF